MHDPQTTLRYPKRSPIVCGHRGMPPHAPENTLESFALAHQSGATWIEFDVRPCADDGVLVVHHDPQTATGQHVASTERAALRADIPTLREVFDACSADVSFDIELKTDEIDTDLGDFVASVLAVIDEYAASVDLSQVLVTSFNEHALALLRAANPAVPTGLLFYQQSVEWAIATAREHGHVAIAPRYSLVDRDAVDAAHAAGLAVVTWTVKTAEQVHAVATAGVDMIISADPALVCATLSDRSD